MAGGCRPTVRQPAPADVWPWPLARGAPPYGSEPPERVPVERSVFVNPQRAAAEAAGRAARGRMPAGSADLAALHMSIQDGMEPWKSGMPKLRGGFIDAAADGVSVAGSAAPLLEPTPRVQ